MVDWERYCNNLSINFVWGPPPSQLDPSTLVPWAWMEQPTLSTPGPGWPSPQAQAGRHLRALPADISKPKMKSVNLNMTFRELAVNWPQLSWRVTRGMFEGWRDMFCFSCCQGETPERPAGVFQVCVCGGGISFFVWFVLLWSHIQWCTRVTPGLCTQESLLTSSGPYGVPGLESTMCKASALLA